MEALEPRYKFKLFSKHEVEDGFFDDVDGIVIGGGFGDSDSYDHLLKHNSDSIKKFVGSGGAYIGICMGSYWADKTYFDILNDIRVVQYIKRPTTDTRRPHAKNLEVTWNNNKERMYFYDGCTFLGNNMDVVATYGNGDPMAIVQGKIGLIGCHPEATRHWYDSYSWMKNKYVNNHALLLDFVDSMI